MCYTLLSQLQSKLVKGVRFNEEVNLNFPEVEIEEIVVLTPKNTRNLQVVWYDFYIPLFSVLVNGKGKILEHQFVHKYDESLPQKLYTVYLLKFITLSDCTSAGFAERLRLGDLK